MSGAQTNISRSGAQAETPRSSGPAAFAVLLTMLLTVIGPHVAQACSVCFGDPNSDLAKGAVRGVAFMIGVVSFVLLGIASIAGVWIVRARRIDREITIAPHDPAQP